MTFFPCQKRHHEPHIVMCRDAGSSVWRDEQCTGQPAWPYTRPKPPHIQDFDACISYQRNFGNITVYKYGGKWLVDHFSLCCDDYHEESFPIDQWPAAINYAQKLAQERSDQRADS